MEDDVVNAIYEKGIRKGLAGKTLQPVIKKIFQERGEYLQKLIEDYYD